MKSESQYGESEQETLDGENEIDLFGLIFYRTISLAIDRSQESSDISTPNFDK